MHQRRVAALTPRHCPVSPLSCSHESPRDGLAACPLGLYTGSPLPGTVRPPAFVCRPQWYPGSCPDLPRPGSRPSAQRPPRDGAEGPAAAAALGLMTAPEGREPRGHGVRGRKTVFFNLNFSNVTPNTSLLNFS